MHLPVDAHCHDPYGWALRQHLGDSVTAAAAHCAGGVSAHPGRGERTAKNPAAVDPRKYTVKACESVADIAAHDLRVAAGVV